MPYQKTTNPLPKVRCPVCGMQVWFRNLARKHKIEAFLVHFGSKGRRKGSIYYEKIETLGKDSLTDFWIKQLKEVLARLEKKSLQEKGLEVVLVPVSPRKRQITARIPIEKVALSVKPTSVMTLTREQSKLTCLKSNVIRKITYD